MNTATDFQVNDTGSIVALTPMTEEAQVWLDENINAESWQYLGNSLCIEHRYADDILNGIVSDGLTIK